MLRRDIYTADVVYDGLGTPRLGGAVVVQTVGDERIVVSVTDLVSARKAHPEATVHTRGFAVAPPPVDAWLEPRQGDAPVQLLTEAAQVGLGAVGLHLVNTDLVAQSLGVSTLPGVAYWRPPAAIFADRGDPFGAIVQQLRQLKGLERPGGLRVGLALEPALNMGLGGRIADLIIQNRVPLAVDLRAPPNRVSSALEALETLGLLRAVPRLIMSWTPSDANIRRWHRAGAVVVYVPELARTSFAWDRLARQGATVALGSGGRSLLLAIRSARQAHGAAVSPRDFVWAAVKGGSRALGLTPPRVLRGDAAGQLSGWDLEQATLRSL